MIRIISIAWILLISLAFADKPKSAGTYGFNAPDGSIYEKCGFFMKEHPAGPNQIEVCLEGQGFYSNSKINAITGKDWFPNIPIYGSPIGKITIRCSDSTEQLYYPTKIKFPTTSEYNEGLKPEIIISCKLSNRIIKKKLAKMATFMRNMYSDQIGVIIKDTDLVKKSCSTNWESVACKNAVKTMDRFFSGQFPSSMGGTLQSCGVNYSLGLKEEVSISANEENDEEYDGGISEENIPSVEEMIKANPHCYASSHGRHDFLKKIHQCLDEIKKFKAFLEKKFNGHIEFFPNGLAIVNGVRIWNTSESGDKLAKLAETLLKEEVQTIQDQAKVEVDDGLIAHGTSQEWTDAFHPSHTSSGEYIANTGQSVGGYFPSSPPENYGDICGLDVECWKRYQALEKQYEDTSHSLPEGKCYHVTGKIIMENGQPKIEYQEVPASSCYHLLDYLNSP